MKRDKCLQRSILKRIEDAQSPYVLFTQFTDNAIGDEQEDVSGWSEEEAYNIRLLLKEGLLALDKITDAPWFGPAPDDVYAETYVTLTPQGHDVLDAPNWWMRAYKNVVANLATLVTTLILAIATQFVLRFFGLN